MGKLSDARHHIERAMTLANEMEDQRSKMEILRNLALVELKEGNSERARALGQKCLEMAQKGHMREMVGKALLVMGEVHAMTLFDESGPIETRARAEQYFLKAITLFRDLGNEAELAKALKRLGEYQIEHDRATEGREVLQEAAEIFDRLKMLVAKDVHEVIKDL